MNGMDGDVAFSLTVKLGKISWWQAPFTRKKAR